MIRVSYLVQQIYHFSVFKCWEACYAGHSGLKTDCCDKEEWDDSVDGEICAPELAGFRIPEATSCTQLERVLQVRLAEHSLFGAQIV